MPIYSLRQSCLEALLGAVVLDAYVVLISSRRGYALVSEGGRDLPYNMVYVLWRRTECRGSVLCTMLL